jgi:hypothetical protein
MSGQVVPTVTPVLGLLYAPTLPYQEGPLYGQVKGKSQVRALMIRVRLGDGGLLLIDER